MTLIISFGSARRKVVFQEGISLVEILSQLEALDEGQWLRQMPLRHSAR